MRRWIVALAVAGLLGGGTTAALAGGSPGPNGNNNGGLCEAAGSGSANGQSHKSSAPPFVALQAAANAYEGSPADPDAATEGTESGPSDALSEYCSQFGGLG